MFVGSRLVQLNALETLIVLESEAESRRHEVRPLLAQHATAADLISIARVIDPSLLSRSDSSFRGNTVVVGGGGGGVGGRGSSSSNIRGSGGVAVCERAAGRSENRMGSLTCHVTPRGQASSYRQSQQSHSCVVD